MKSSADTNASLLPHNDTPKRDTKYHVGLRALEPEDLDLLYAIENDPGTWASTAHAAFYSRYVLKQYIAAAANDIFADGQLRLVATLQMPQAEGASSCGDGTISFGDGTLSSGEGTLPCDEGKRLSVPIGLADMTGFDPMHQRAEIGLIMLPAYRGKGLAVSVLNCLVAHAQRLHIHQLWATVAETNAAAKAMMAAARFYPSALLRQWLRTDANYVDARIWQRIID